MGNIITISRTFGSGGREVGKRLAEALGYAYYDKELINLIAEETGFAKEFVEKYSESGFGQTYAIHTARTFTVPYQMPGEQLQIAQSNILKKIAEEGNCVIVGRRADYILREYDPFKVFVYATDMDSRIARCYAKVPEDKALSEKAVEKNIRVIDKDRAKYYNYFCTQKWGDMQNYNFCVDTSKVEVKKAVDMLASIYR
ncbi:MAG: cytidylate kinase-like family protein [Faecalibacterium sp.]